MSQVYRRVVKHKFLNDQYSSAGYQISLLSGLQTKTDTYANSVDPDWTALYESSHPRTYSVCNCVLYLADFPSLQ